MKVTDLVRQRESFLVLMSNYNQVLNAQAIQLHSAGLATERYEIYMDSIEGKANTLKASMETLWQKAINDDVIKFFLDLGIVSVETIDKMGGLIPILEAVIGLVGVLSAQTIINLIGKLSAATVAIEGFSFSLISLQLLLKTTMSWVSILQVAIGALTAVVITYQQTVKKQQDLGLENTTNAWTDAFNNLGEEIKTTEQVMGEYKKMVNSVNDAHEKGGLIASLFVDKQKILDQGLKEVIATLKETTSNYRDYIEAVERAAKLAGYTIDENGRFIKSTGLTQQAIVKTGEDFGVLTDAELGLFNASQESLDTWAYNWIQSLYTIDEHVSDLTVSYEQLKNEVDAITKAYEEQNENGYISIQTANELVMANADLYQYLIRTKDGYVFSAEAARIDTFAKLQNVVASYNLQSATIAAANGNYALAISAIKTSIMLDAEKESAIGLINLLSSLASLSTIDLPAVSAGGGGGGGKSPEQIASEEQKKAYEKEKEALEDLKKEWKDRLDAFKDYIKAQKESLRLKKEESDFSDKLAKKNKDLAEIQAEIALLELDNSEEAKAKRLELEQEAADLQVEIEEDKEDRKYELQMDAYDKAESEYESYVDSIIKGIDNQIEAINDLVDALNDMISKATGGSGGGFPKLGKSIQEIINNLHALGIATEGLTEMQLRNIDKMIDRWKQLGFSVQQYARLAKAAAEAALKNYDLSEMNKIAQEIYESQHGAGSTMPAVAKHDGGLIESHHDGNFAGNLKSNEVFAKLLKGEYVATEGQMDNFLKNILPKISMEMPKVYNNDSSSPMVSVNMPITVEGNMDKNVVPDINKIADKVINEINISLKQRGFVRQTSLTSYV